MASQDEYQQQQFFKERNQKLLGCEMNRNEIAIYNITNGERFTTYAISAEKNSGIISINGAAAHKANPGDMLIIATYSDYNELELEKYAPSLVYVDSNNKITITKNSIDIQAA